MTNDVMKKYGTTSISFKNYLEAERYYNELRDRWYSNDDISIFMSDATKDSLPSHLNVADTDGSMAWVGTWSMIWGTAWGIIGAIAAIGTAVVFPVAWLVIAGPILGALTGVGAWWLLGGIAWALAHSGVNQEDADNYAGKIKDGEIVIVVDSKSDDDSIYFDGKSSSYEKTYYSNTYKQL